MKSRLVLEPNFIYQSKPSKPTIHKKQLSKMRIYQNKNFLEGIIMEKKKLLKTRKKLPLIKAN